MEINLKLASLNDLDLILAFVSAYHAFERLESTASERASTIRKLLLSSDFGGIWLIYCNNELAGYIALCRGYSIEFQGFEAFIDEFFLSAEFRGKGIGTQVLESIKKEVSKLNVKVLHLEVARDNKIAQNLYVKAGFQAREKYILMSKEL